MNRHLILLRHAKSDWKSSASTDYDRPLAKRGQLDAPRMGKWLQNNNAKPDYVLSSPALRAWQTTEAVCNTQGINPQDVHQDKNIYLADLTSLLSILANIPANYHTVLLVGHNPGLDQLLTYLVANNLVLTKNGKLMTTAAAAILSMPDDWKNLPAHSAELINLVRPKEL